MSLDSSRKFNGGQSREKERKAEKRRTGSSRFPRWRRRRRHRPSFSSSRLRNVLAFVDGSHCSSRLHLLPEAAAATAAKDWQRSPPLRSAPMHLFRRPLPIIRRLTTPGNLYLAYTSTGWQKHSRVGDDSQTSEARRPPRGSAVFLSRGRFFFSPSQSLSGRVKREDPMWSIKKKKNCHGRDKMNRFFRTPSAETSEPFVLFYTICVTDKINK